MTCTGLPDNKYFGGGEKIFPEARFFLKIPQKIKNDIQLIYK